MRGQRLARERGTWRAISSYKVKYGATSDAPPWYPGRPFAFPEEGWHVRELQAALGVKETGRFNRDTEARVRGLQQVAGHPVSGVVDAITACLIDPGPWADLVPPPRKRRGKRRDTKRVRTDV